jgi:hypothetical protein
VLKGSERLLAGAGALPKVRCRTPGSFYETVNVPYAPRVWSDRIVDAIE